MFSLSSTGSARTRRLGLVAGLTDSSMRTEAARSLALLLGAEDLIVFTPDPGIGVLLPAPGFLQTLPAGNDWMSFLSTCINNGENIAFLPYPTRDLKRQAHGFAGADGSVLVLIGGNPDRGDVAELTLLLPLLAAAFRGERLAMNARGDAQMAAQSASEAHTLADTLDRARRDLSTALNEARNSRQRFEQFMQHLPGLAWIKDSGGRYVYANNAALQAFGVAGEQLRDRSGNEIFTSNPGCLQDRLKGSPNTTVESRQVIETVRHSDGTVHHLLVTSFPIPAGDGDESLVGGIAVDITERILAEEALRDRENYLRAIIETTPDCVKVVGADGRVLEINQAGLAMVEADRAEAATDTCVYDFIAEEDRPAFRAFNDLVCGGAGGTLQFDIIGLKGTRRTMETHAVPLAAADGTMRQLAITRDVTERRQAELALRASEAQFRQLADALPQIVWTARPDGYNDYYNERWYEYTGFPRGEYGDSSWMRIIHPEDLDRAVETYNSCIRSGRVYQIEYRFKCRKTGGYRWFLGRAYPVRNEAGQIVRWFGTCTDIDETKRAEENVRRKNNHLQLLNATAAHLLSADDPGIMLQSLFLRIKDHLGLDAYLNFTANEGQQVLTLASFSGIPEESARSIKQINFGHDICGNVALLREPILALAIQHSEDPDLEFARRHGFRAYACNPLVAGSRLLGTLSFASGQRDRFDDDETEFLRTLCHYVAAAFERVRLIGRLRESDRRKDEFLATLGHELRNPLAPISNSLRMLRAAGGTTPTVDHLQTILERQVTHMVRLVDDLLEVSRITRGKIQLRKEKIDVASVIGAAVETSRPLIDAAHHEIAVHFPAKPIMLEVDIVRMTQVIANLLNNAANYTEAGGRIVLTAEREGAQAVISVRDNGVGIASDKLAHIFDMFAQVHGSFGYAVGGLGIGLTLARSLVQMHGGSIEGRSAGPGCGSEFIVRLPALAERTEILQPPHAVRPIASGPGYRIMVVDDNHDSADSLSMFLNFSGNEVHTAYDGEEALAEALKFQPDVMLLDIGMPRLDGYETARRIRAQAWGQRIVLIACSGWGQEEDKQRAAECGFDAHITKPADLSAVNKLCRDLVATKRNLSRAS